MPSSTGNQLSLAPIPNWPRTWKKQGKQGGCPVFFQGPMPCSSPSPFLATDLTSCVLLGSSTQPGTLFYPCFPNLPISLFIPKLFSFPRADLLTKLSALNPRKALFQSSGGWRPRCQQATLPGGPRKDSTLAFLLAPVPGALRAFRG